MNRGIDLPQKTAATTYELPFHSPRLSVRPGCQRCPARLSPRLCTQSVGLPPESNTQLWRAQFVPNTTRTGGHPGFVGVMLSLTRKQNPLVSASSF